MTLTYWPHFLSKASSYYRPHCTNFGVWMAQTVCLLENEHTDTQTKSQTQLLTLHIPRLQLVWVIKDVIINEWLIYFSVTASCTMRISYTSNGRYRQCSATVKQSMARRSRIVIETTCWQTAKRPTPDPTWDWSTWTWVPSSTAPLSWTGFCRTTQHQRTIPMCSKSVTVKYRQQRLTLTSTHLQWEITPPTQPRRS